jgi:hypothetical protein
MINANAGAGQPFAIVGLVHHRFGEAVDKLSPLA